jgi:acetyltransferase-like isoleucine patch superfamily enzyme
MIAANNPSLQSWVEVPNGSDFPIQNLPFGIFKTNYSEARVGIRIGNQVSIGSYSQIIVSTSLNDPGEGISLGDRVGIGEFAYLGGGGGLTIGADCIVGQYFSCHPENHNYSDPETLIRLQGVSRKGIQIGNGCWIGSKVTILDGAKVGNHCVIAAGAVVAGVFPDHSVIGGVPARILKSRIQQSAA